MLNRRKLVDLSTGSCNCMRFRCRILQVSDACWFLEPPRDSQNSVKTTGRQRAVLPEATPQQDEIHRLYGVLTAGLVSLTPLWYLHWRHETHETSCQHGRGAANLMSSVSNPKPWPSPRWIHWNSGLGVRSQRQAVTHSRTTFCLLPQY